MLAARRQRKAADPAATTVPAPAAPGAATASALERATAVPRDIVELATEVAAMAETLARDGKPNLAGDATTALLLARAGAEAATNLVAINVAENR